MASVVTSPPTLQTGKQRTAKLGKGLDEEPANLLVDLLVILFPFLSSVFATPEKYPAGASPLVRWTLTDERRQVPDKLNSITFLDAVLSSPLASPERDLVFVKSLIVMVAMLLPLFYCLFAYDLPWYYGLLYTLLELRFKGTFISIMHCSSHAPIYKKGWRWLQNFVPAIGMLFGQPPFTYQMHHLKMHHVENNGLGDLSSTVLYQRDSFIGFLHYYFRFFFFIHIELPFYFLKKGQFKHMFLALAGESTFYICTYFLWQINPVMTIFTMIIPFKTSRFGMMSANWGQHSLIDPKRPKSDWGSSITVTNCYYNLEAFMDGYHTSHHLNPRRHWRDHRDYMVKNEQKFKDNGALIFEGIDFHGVWFYLMTHNYEKLASHVVYIDGELPSTPEVVRKLKERTRKFTREEILAAKE